MTNTVNTVGLYVRDQDEALAFYVGTLGFEVHRRAQWQLPLADGTQPGQDGFQLGLFVPGPPTHDAATAQALQQLVAKGAMPPLVLARG
jgi:catechol 2,3-dioxygenase-like lactoylglutathione lyase family enzyme